MKRKTKETLNLQNQIPFISPSLSLLSTRLRTPKHLMKYFFVTSLLKFSAIEIKWISAVFQMAPKVNITLHCTLKYNVFVFEQVFLCQVAGRDYIRFIISTGAGSDVGHAFGR